MMVRVHCSFPRRLADGLIVLLLVAFRRFVLSFWLLSFR